MPRRKVRANKAKAEPVELLEIPEEEVEDQETEEEAEAEEASQPDRLAPRKDEDARQVYLQAGDQDVQTFSKENYSRLAGFINQMPNRSSFGIFVYRLEKVPGEGQKRRYLGHIELPGGLLEHNLKEQFGGGEFFWQLAKDGMYAARTDLPADMNDVKLSGSCTVAGAARDLDAKPPAVAVPNESQSAVMDVLKDQIKGMQKESSGSAQAMVQLMTVLMAGMQQQQNMAQQLASQQTTFMMNLMALQDKKTESMMAGKETLYKEIIDLMKNFAGGNSGEPEGFGAMLLKAAPGILDKLSLLPGLSNVSPRKNPETLPARPMSPPPRPAAPAVPAAPAPVQAVPVPIPGSAFTQDDEPYLTQMVAAVWEGFKASAPIEATSEIVANLGTEEQFDKLLEQSNDWVSAVTQAAWASFKPAEAVPDGLLAYARAVHVELCSEVPAIPEARPAVFTVLPAVAPAVAPAAPAPAPPAAPGPSAPPIQS